MSLQPYSIWLSELFSVYIYMLGLAHLYFNCCRIFKKADATFISYINIFVIKDSQAFIQIFRVYPPIP